MTGPRDDDIFAAEYALGLLEGAELAEAKTRAAADPAFAALADAWTDRLTPILGRAATPPEDIWGRIAARLSVNDDGPATHPALRRWRALALAAGSLAAALALFILFQPAKLAPAPAQTAETGRPLLVAALKSDDTSAAVAVGIEPGAGQLLITPLGLGSDSRVPELWVIPEDGRPRSLGVIEAATPSRLVVSRDLRPHFHGGSTLAISMEPNGGSPSGAPTGPVVASGKIIRV